MADNNNRSNPGTSSNGPESVPLMPHQTTDNNYQLGNGGNTTNETVVDMNGSPVQRPSNNIPADLDVDGIVSLIPAELDEERNVCRAMFAAIIRNNNIDCPQNIEPRSFQLGSQRSVPVATMTLRTDLQFLTLLQWSAVTDLHYLIEPLTGLGADLTQVTKESNLSLLMIAAQYRNENFLLTALRTNASVAEKLLGHTNSANETVFEIICKGGLVDFVKKLLAEFESYYTVQNAKGFSHFQRAFSSAIKQGNTDLAKTLISSKAPINAKDRTGNQPLILAVNLKREEIVLALLDNPDCDVNVVASTRDTPLMLAAKGDNREILISLLNSKNINIDKITETSRGSKTALSEASRLGKLENMEELLIRGAKMIAQDGETVCNSLQVAVKAKQVKSSEKLIEKLMEKFSLETTGDETSRKGFEDVLLQCTVSDDSHLLTYILNHPKFEQVLENMGGKVLLWRGLMKASEKGRKQSVLAYLDHTLCPKVTQNCDLEDLATDNDISGDTPLHRMASTCLDDELIQKIAGITNPKPSEDDSPLSLPPNWLLFRSNSGKTVLEYMSSEDTLITFLRLNEFQEEKTKWVDSYPKDDPQQVFKHPVCSMDRKVLHQCIERFPEASELLLSSAVIACGWGAHDENLEILLNWKVMNEALPSMGNPCSSDNSSGEQHSDTLVVASKHNPDLLATPVMRLLQRKHWYKLSVHFFRAQILAATLLALLVTTSILSWKNGVIRTPILFFTLFITSACLFVHVLQILGSFHKYVAVIYNWLQVLLYVAIFIETCVALSVNDSRESSLDEKRKVKEDFQSKKCWFSFLILFAWLNLFAILQKSILLGIYIIMFKNALFSFIRIAIPLSLLLSSFGLTFYGLYSNASGTLEENNIQNYVMKILSMTIGSVDGDAMGSDSDSFLYNPRFFLIVIFVVMVTIITFNLLTGIVIQDVEQATKNSELYLMQLRIQVISETEVLANLLGRFFPCKQWLVFDDLVTVISPNQPKSLFNKLVSYFAFSKPGFMSNEIINKELLDVCRNIKKE